MIQGEIYSFPLPDLIQWVAYTERTGELIVEHGANQVDLHFDAGKIANISFDMITCDGPESARVALSAALPWRWGRFVFKDRPISSISQGPSLNLPTEAILSEIIRQSEAEQEAVAGPASGDWNMAEDKIGNVTMADSLRLRVADRLLRNDFRVPPMPELATRLLELTRNLNFSLRELSEIILTEQSVIATILRHANSALHSHEREIGSLPMAVQRLGSDEVVNIVLAVSLHARMPGRDLFVANRRALWTHSSTAALFARSIATVVELDHNMAFLCGLLADFGTSVLYTLIQEVIGRGPKSEQIKGDVVGEIIRVYHQGVGRTVGEKWKLPRAVIESMAHHHDVEGAVSEQPYVAVSALADILASFALSLPRDGFEQSLATMRPEHIASHAAAKIIDLDTEKAAEVLADLPKQLDRALQFATD